MHYSRNLQRASTLARCSLLVLAMALGGCAARPILIEQSAYWPFERVRVRSTAAGELTAYAARAPAAVRTVVILQTSPCGAAPPESADPILSTGGVLWDELKQDSLMIQLEPPGVGREETTVGSANCRPELRSGLPASTWSRAVKEVVRAVEGKAHLPTAYIGIGQGAWPAAQLAATDPRATALLLVNGTGLNPRFESLLAQVNPIAGAPAQDLLAGIAATPQPLAAQPLASLPATKVPTLLVQSAGSRDSPLASALLLLSQRASTKMPLSLLVVEGLGADFGLNQGKIECFESVMRLLAQATVAASPPAPNAMTRTYCSLPDREAPTQPRTAPVRMPDQNAGAPGADESR